MSDRHNTQIKTRSRDISERLNDHRQRHVISQSAPSSGPDYPTQTLPELGRSYQQVSECRRSGSSYLLSFWSSSQDTPLSRKTIFSVKACDAGRGGRNVNESKKQANMSTQEGSGSNLACEMSRFPLSPPLYCLLKSKGPQKGHQ